MDHKKRVGNSLQQCIDDHLSSLESQRDPSAGANTASELVAALDNLLLGKAKEELRAGELVAAVDDLLLEKAAEELRDGKLLAAEDNVSLGKAAEELRVARTRLNKLKLEIGERVQFTTRVA